MTRTNRPEVARALQPTLLNKLILKGALLTGLLNVPFHTSAERPSHSQLSGVTPGLIPLKREECD